MGTTGSASDGEAVLTSTYCTLARLRAITHFKTTAISDSDVNLFIPDADRAIMRLATIEVYDEKLKGDIDGVNTLFTSEHAPIADIDFDADVDGDDVTVNRVAYDSEENPESTEVTVSSVNARDGIITLSAAPTTVNAEVGIYADYRYYKRPVDYDVLKLAANYYLAHLCEIKVRTSEVEGSRGGISKLPMTDSARSRWLKLAYDQLPFAKASVVVV